MGVRKGGNGAPQGGTHGNPKKSAFPVARGPRTNAGEGFSYRHVGDRSGMEALDAAGAAIVGNDLALGNRHYSGSADESGDMSLSLVRRHLRRDPCSTLHESGRTRIERLIERFAWSGADRLLMLRVRQCEPESGDVPDMADECRGRGIPFLCLDIDLHAEERASARVRIEAFVEMGE